jgi:hypothetical protein
MRIAYCQCTVIGCYVAEACLLMQASKIVAGGCRSRHRETQDIILDEIVPAVENPTHCQGFQSRALNLDMPCVPTD